MLLTSTRCCYWLPHPHPRVTYGSKPEILWIFFKKTQRRMSEGALTMKCECIAKEMDRLLSCYSVPRCDPLSLKKGGGWSKPPPPKGAESTCPGLNSSGLKLPERTSHRPASVCRPRSAAQSRTKQCLTNTRQTGACFPTTSTWTLRCRHSEADDVDSFCKAQGLIQVSQLVV